MAYKSGKEERLELNERDLGFYSTRLLTTGAEKGRARRAAIGKVPISEGGRLGPCRLLALGVDAIREDVDQVSLSE